MSIYVDELMGSSGLHAQATAIPNFYETINKMMEKIMPEEIRDPGNAQKSWRTKISNAVSNFRRGGERGKQLVVKPRDNKHITTPLKALMKYGKVRFAQEGTPMPRWIDVLEDDEFDFEGCANQATHGTAEVEMGSMPPSERPQYKSRATGGLNNHVNFNVNGFSAQCESAGAAPEEEPMQAPTQPATSTTSAPVQPRMHSRVVMSAVCSDTFSGATASKRALPSEQTNVTAKAKQPTR